MYLSGVGLRDIFIGLCSVMWCHVGVCRGIAKEVNFMTLRFIALAWVTQEP